MEVSKRVEFYDVIEDVCMIFVDEVTNKYRKEPFFRVTVKYKSDVIYNEDFSAKEWAIYNHFIKERAYILLQDCGKLHDEYVMAEIAGRMYKLDDLDYVDNHRKLVRMFRPCDYKVEEGHKIDLLIGCTLYDMFTYPKNCLVYKFKNFYLNGIKLGGMELIKDIGIRESDLHYGIPSKVKEYFENEMELTINSYETEHSSGDF